MTAPLPGPLAPMLATPGPMPATADGWSFEVKWDGMRAVAHCRDDGTLTVRSRTLRDVTAQWPELASLAAAVPGGAVLDGELIAVDDSGRPSFERLQPRMHATPATARAAAALHPVVYVLFDVLWLAGENICTRPYAERRERLSALGLDAAAWRTPGTLTAEDPATIESAVRGLGLEGVVAKRTSSTYRPGERSPHWRKVKFLLSQEFVVGGWTEGLGARTGSIGSLLLGVNDTGTGDLGLRYCGRVGTGLSDAELDHLAATLAPLAVDASPFTADAPRSTGLHWVRPEVVVEVAFTEWTAAGVLRQPTYRGRRTDKDPTTVVRET